MSNEVVRLVQKYRSQGVLVDTNLLLLYCIGKYRRELVAQFKRTASRGFTADDFDLLAALLSNFQRIIATPNILTEVSNLLGQLGEPVKTACLNVFAQEIAIIEEQYIPGDTAAQTEVYCRLGLTDAGILSVAQGSCLVLTEDFDLDYSLRATGVDVLNLNHLRPL